MDSKIDSEVQVLALTLLSSLRVFLFLMIALFFFFLQLILDLEAIKNRGEKKIISSFSSVSTLLYCQYFPSYFVVCACKLFKSFFFRIKHKY